MSSNTEINHATMVRALMKPSSELHDASTPRKWALIHAIVGIAGEIGEVDNAKDSVHLLEEAGDVLFYCRDYRHILGLPEFVPMLTDVRDGTSLISVVLDHMKRLCIYNYEMDEKRHQAMHKLIDEIESYVSIALEDCGFTREDALQANIEKLLTGPNARYKDGVYSDLAAQLRADKNPDEDDV